MVCIHCLLIRYVFCFLVIHYFLFCYMFIFIYFYAFVVVIFFFFKQKTAYEMRISDWSSDVCSSDLPVTGRSGTAKSLAYHAKSRTLYVLHTFGPNHLRAYKVSKDGKLKLLPAQHSVDTATKVGRVATQAVVSPDGRFLLVDILFDAHPSANPDGTPNLVVTNAPDPDGLVVFPIHDDGTLGKASFNDAGGAGPFYITFLHGSKDTFLNGVAVGDGVLMSRIDEKGHITNEPLVPIDTSAGKPSELCWLQVTSDNSVVLATNFGYGTVSSYRITEIGRAHV